MNRYVCKIHNFNDESDYLTLQRNYVFVVPLAPHLLCNDVLFAILFIVFPKVVDDPQVDKEFQEDEATYNCSWNHLKGLKQEVIVFLNVIFMKYLHFFMS